MFVSEQRSRISDRPDVATWAARRLRWERRLDALGRHATPTPDAAIEVRGLRKEYGEREALRGVDLRVERGEVFGLLGPNGAGKTTTVEILEGYRDRTAGDVRVLGVDPQGQPLELRKRVGVVPQDGGLPR